MTLELEKFYRFLPKARVEVGFDPGVNRDEPSSQYMRYVGIKLDLDVDVVKDVCPGLVVIKLTARNDNRTRNFDVRRQRVGNRIVIQSEKLYSNRRFSISNLRYFKHL